MTFYDLKQKLADLQPWSAQNGHIIWSGVMLFIISGSLAAIGLGWLISGILGAIGSFAIGYASELNDAKQPGNFFDKDDIVLNVIGIVMAFVVWNLIGVV